MSLESLEETLDILANPQLLADIRQAEAEVAGGQAQILTKEEAQSLIRRR